MLSSMVVVLIILSLKSYYYYVEIKDEIIFNAKKEAHLLQDYMMSVREVFHKQFLASGLELNDKTLGFLPAHATTLISNKFQNKNKYNFYIRNVSDIPRNKTNMADKEEMKAIKYFKNKPKKLEYFKKYKKNGNEYFQFASPIYIKPYCLACHGKKENALPTIRHRYKTAYNYKVGDVRGIVSIKIPNDKINKIFYIYLKRELFITFLTFIIILFIFFIIFKNVLFQIKDIETNALDFASTDELTNLHNRKYLNTFQQNIKSTIKNKGDFIIAFLDIDYFKKVNDTYGHVVGDIILKEFAILLRSLSEAEDIVCRYGGEEFLIIVYNTSLEKAIEKFNNIRAEVANKKINFENYTINITVSIGIDMGTTGDSIEVVISNADKALYKAKENGRNRIEIYNQKSNDAILA